MKDSQKPITALISDPITPTLIKFAYPLLITNLLHTITGTWNAVWVGHVLGPIDLVAVVNANVMLAILIGSVMGFGLAAGGSIGQSVGGKDLHSARRVVGTAMAFAILGGLVVAAVGQFGVQGIVSLIQIPEEARERSVTYFRILCFSMPTQFIFLFTMMILRNSGDARTPFIFSMIWIGLGLIFTPLLLTGTFGFPKMGIAGAALSPWIANASALTGLIAYVYFKKMPLALRGRNLKFLKPNPQILWMLAKRGIPTAAESLIVQGAYFLLLILVNGYGVITAAGYSAAAQLWGYIMMPTMAVSASMSAMAAQNIGANQWDRVEYIAWRGCALAMFCTAVITLIMYLLGDNLLKLFLPGGGQSLIVAREINNIVLWSWPIIAITFGLFAIVKANGVMLPSALIFAITMWGLRIPFATVLQPLLGASAIWWSFPLGVIASAALAYAYYRFGNWRQQKLMSNELGN